MGLSRGRRTTVPPEPAPAAAAGRLVAAALVSLPASAAACGGRSQADPRAPFSGRVVGVLDGDSLLVLRDGRQVTVRLHGVDAPEGGQAYGNVARRALSNLAFGKSVDVQVRDVDRYERLVSRVSVDGTDVGLELVRGGFAWHYTRYLKDRDYAAAQQEARAERRGLWQDRDPVAPWDWRADPKNARTRPRPRRE